MGVFDIETDVIICQKMEALYWEACANYKELTHSAAISVTIFICACIFAIFLGILFAYFYERNTRNDK